MTQYQVTDTNQLAHGFFTADEHIYLIPSVNGIDPDVVIDHESSHAALIAYSSLGMFEEALAMYKDLGEFGGPQEWERAFDRLITELRGWCAQVHEAVAWFGTELLTAAKGSLTCPKSYRRDVDRLWRLYKRTKTMAPEMSDDSFLNVTRAIGVVALSPPVTRVLFRAVVAGSGTKNIRKCLGRRSQTPVRRFRRLCAAFMTASPESLMDFADELLSTAPRRTEEVPSTTAFHGFMLTLAPDETILRAELEAEARELLLSLSVATFGVWPRSRP
jgi:hypothetical protein